MNYLTRSMAHTHTRMAAARSRPVVRASPKPGKVRAPTRRSEPPIVGDGDNYADWVLRLARSRRPTAFATHAAEARWAHRELSKALAEIHRDLRLSDFPLPDELLIRRVEVEVRIGTLAAQYAREWYRSDR